MNDGDFLLLIDGSSLLSTQFYGNLPREIVFAKTMEEKEKYFHKIMQTKKGVYTNAVYGFLRSLLRILKEQKPAYLAVAWDLSRNTFRRELYAEYKGNRFETMEPLKDQFKLCQDVLLRLGIRQFMDERYEADDFCGTLSLKFEKELPVKILTKDNDYLQLVSENTNLWLMHGTQKKTEELIKKYKLPMDGKTADRCINLTPELVKAEFGIEPASVNSLKGLMGDTSDNIKGVPGIGEMTAVALIAAYRSVEALYEDIDGLSEAELKTLAAKWKTELGISRSPIKYLTAESDSELVGKKAAFLSKELATIKRDIDLSDISLNDLAVSIDRVQAQKVFDELEFKTLTADLPGENRETKVTFNFSEITDFAEAENAFALIENTEPGTVLGFNIFEQDGAFCGLALSINGGTNYYFAAEGFITKEYLVGKLTKLSEKDIILSGTDIKSTAKKYKIAEQPSWFDTGIAAYLIDPLAGEYPLSALAGKYADETCGNEAASAEESARLAMLTAQVAKELGKQLNETGMLPLFNEIEMPLCFTLAAMEQRGILVRQDELKAYGEQLAEGIEKLEKEIYEDVGETFNINSPKQLGVILFEKLKLPYGKKTKTGYSTSADVLEKLKSEEPVVEKILDYRQLTKLKSTYADGLAGYIEADGRIRSSFNQTITATGRLSSTEPNLQNIPIRVELGKLIRKVFVPREGYCFLDADYSQIELRLLTSMSEDEKLINAYNSDMDIHRITASEVFHVPLPEVTPALRSRAKAVNFGIVYGISSFGLGQDLNISRKEAEEYIAGYFETYPKVKTYLDRLVSEAQGTGYSVTAFGRRRPIPELASTNFMQRQFGERIAMNSPIQGTAADVIKIAMIRVEKRLAAEGLKSKLLLQVHDELLIETELSEKDRVRSILVEEMQGAAKMAVRLEANVEEGENWYDAH